MFEDSRSKKVLFAAHCILNQNAVSDMTAVSPGMLKEVVDILDRYGVGVVQMPCPELSCLGLDRGNIQGSQSPVVRENSRIRTMMEGNPAAFRIKELVQQVVFQIREYRKHHFNILGIVGINRSPSCGVDTTSINNREVSGKGVFMTVLKRDLQHADIDLPFIGIKPSQMADALQSVGELMEKNRS